MAEMIFMGDGIVALFPVSDSILYSARVDLLSLNRLFFYVLPLLLELFGEFAKLFVLFFRVILDFWLVLLMCFYRPVDKP